MSASSVLSDGLRGDEIDAGDAHRGCLGLKIVAQQIALGEDPDATTVRIDDRVGAVVVTVLEVFESLADGGAVVEGLHICGHDVCDE